MFAITFDGAGAALHLLAQSLDGFALVGMGARREPVAGMRSSTTPSRTARASWSATSSRDALADCYQRHPLRRGRGARPYGSYVEDGTSRNRPYPYLARVGSHRGRLCRRDGPALQEAVRAAGGDAWASRPSTPRY